MKTIKRVGIITQARMTSTRLPGKILKRVKDISILKYHIDRLKWSELAVYVATTINDTDNPVIEFCLHENLPTFRGSENNVLSRYYECAKQNHLEIVIRVTSDCPLIDGHLIKKAYTYYLDHFQHNLYYSNCHQRTFPRGFDFEIFSFQLLEEAYQKAVMPSDLEHVTPYIHQNRNGNVSIEHFTIESNASQYRITLDTPEDFELIKILIEKYGADKLNYDAIISLLEQHPELIAINTNVHQKTI
ncbi:MAG: acylneuraminate cytidylyltransferase [Bacteroidetes bacterium RIFCSPLOWO2_02_FULL_36_8]|nr:MAG: acylneuraminate cytidylyltransferase [Bacteroidetes bacterium RIFCSPLOWO2_02_FULL_36_8]OFY71014.1 MAG: acylneuraminate cytidylyltransferase [Bacteroidetes bacterium RIFCSPLOWO2_12_FULL_37_12]